MASIVIKDWDNKTWLSSKEYIKKLNSFIIKEIKLNKSSQILDIGCGRGKIIGNLSTRLNLKTKPIGIDIVKHKDKDKRILFKKTDALSFFSHNKKKFDLILIKQTIHLLKNDNIKKLINNCKKKLNLGGVILIFTIDPNKNEIPSFQLMKENLNKSLQRDRHILRMLRKHNNNIVLKKFYFKVKISKLAYLKMIQNRFISTLLKLRKEEIAIGLNELKLKTKNILKFNDNLICIIIKN
tara:strand:+ start:141 stop:857 length:717 start_codon:yes stop_codon:yes gene_type:complete